MLKSSTQIEWHFLQEPEQDEDVALAHPPTNTRQRPGTGYVYELLIGVVLFAGVAFFLLWQQTENRLVEIESELAALRRGIQQPVPDEEALRVESPGTTEQVEFETIITEAIRARNIQPQWRSLTSALQTYLQRERTLDANWQYEQAFLARRHSAQRRTIQMAVRARDTTHALEMSQHYLTADEVADPLIEYILETYGYLRLPALLDGFEEHATWEELAPDVFDVSAEQFEESWHGYLHLHYPLEQE